MNERVIELTTDDLSWPFQNTNPRLHNTEVDPFPAYAHERALVERTLKHVESCCEIPHKPTLYIFHHEPMGRTNGWASQGYGEYDDEKQRYTLGPGEIILAGKRIPPHPAMTRYLVAHEYGHHVDWAICEKRGLDFSSGFDKEYANLRTLPDGYDRYGGGRWHSNVGEFIANDFRILVAEVEPEFWPHRGYARPEEVPGLRQWWKDALA